MFYGLLSMMALVATWVAEQQPAASAQRRKQETLDAYRALHSNDAGAEVGVAHDGYAATPSTAEAPVADPAHRTG